MWIENSGEVCSRMKYAYWIDNIPEMSSVKKYLLYEYASSAEEIYHTPVSHMKTMKGITEEDIKKIQKSKKSWEIEQKWFELLEQGIGFVSSEDEKFPERLRYISNPPYALYYIGSLPDEKRKSVAIVGARGRSAYGSEITQYLAKTLAEHGVQVISGLAKGIDGDAHNGALKGGGETFGVLGCGVDVCYPKSHKYLYEKLIQNGGIISEYTPRTQPIPWQFPARNRIISGLSDCVVVMEAKERSGSLITADFAME